MLLYNRLLIVLCLCTLTAISTRGQERPPAYEHLKELESFIGTWSGDFDPPGDIPAGTLSMTFRWTGNRSYVCADVLFGADSFPKGKQMNPEFIVIGYDADEQTTKSWHFLFAKQGKMTAQISPDQIILHQQRGEEGTEKFESQTKTFKLIGSGEMSITTVSVSGSNDSDSKRDEVVLLRDE